MTVTCRFCQHQFEVDDDRYSIVCPKCRKEVNLLWKPIKPGDKIVDRANYKGRFK